MFYGAIVVHCTIHVKLLLLDLVLRQEQGVNIKQHNVLELVFVVFSISVEKRNSSSSELVKLVFLVLYFLSFALQTSSFPTTLPRCPVMSQLQTVQQLICSCMHPYCLLITAKKENIHLINFHLGGVTNFSYFSLADTLTTATSKKIVL